MRRLPTPTTTPDPPPTAGVVDPATSASSYDWVRFGRHRFRTPGAVVVDSPLPLAGAGWMATVWPDAAVPGGWARMLWQPDPACGRGWLIPDRLALGDVLEFGAHRPGGDAHSPAGADARWYGILDSYEVAAWLTAQGPYPDPAAAFAEAERLLAGERYLPPLDTQQRHGSTRPCARHPRRRTRHP